MNQLVKLQFLLFKDLNNFKEYNLTINELPKFDQTIDFIMLLNAQKKTLAENNHLIEKLRYTNKKLDQKMVELKNKQQLLVQSAKLASLGQMASGIAHELNNPLFLILGACEHLQEQLKKYKSLDIKNSMELIVEIDQNVGRMKKIITNLKSFSRQPLNENKIISLLELVEKSLSLVSEQLRLNAITVKIGIDPGIKISGDFNKLEQIFVNLFDNSKDAIEDIKTKRQFGQINIDAIEMENFVVIKFQDNGRGIESNILENVFDPFFTTKNVGKGTGLGLSILHGIVSEHNGNVSIISEVGEGTTFTLELPKVGT